MIIFGPLWFVVAVLIICMFLNDLPGTWKGVKWGLKIGGGLVGLLLILCFPLQIMLGVLSIAFIIGLCWVCMTLFFSFGDNTLFEEYTKLKSYTIRTKSEQELYKKLWEIYGKE